MVRTHSKQPPRKSPSSSPPSKYALSSGSRAFAGTLPGPEPAADPGSFCFAENRTADCDMVRGGPRRNRVAVLPISGRRASGGRPTHIGHRAVRSGFGAFDRRPETTPTPGSRSGVVRGTTGLGNVFVVLVGGSA